MTWLLFTQKRVSGEVFSCKILSSREGEVHLGISGTGCYDLFKNEIGAQKWQRIPPTETKGRRHSSTFTVAVFKVEEANIHFNESDIEFQTTVGTGPGGQHKNKTESAVRAKHITTGMTVFIQNERSQTANKIQAVQILRSRVIQQQKENNKRKSNKNRQDQIGDGNRSNKIRTIQEQNDRVIDHRTNKKTNIARYRKGEIWRLH